MSDKLQFVVVAGTNELPNAIDELKPVGHFRSTDFSLCPSLAAECFGTSGI